MTAAGIALSSAGIGDAAPAITPLEAAGVGVTAWQNNKRIVGLYSTNNNRNSWIFVDGIGWRKFADSLDVANVALSMLDAHAREKSSPVNLREESDNKIYEIYVW